MAQNKNKCRRTIIRYHCCLRVTQFRQAALDKDCTTAASPGCEVNLEIHIAGPVSSRSRGFNGRPPQVRMHHHPCSINHPLQSRKCQVTQPLPYSVGNLIMRWNLLALTKRRQFLSDSSDHHWTRKVTVADSIKQRIDTGNPAQVVLRLGHQFTVINGSVGSVSLPNDSSLKSAVNS